jgi:hypothetical protein
LKQLKSKENFNRSDDLLPQTEPKGQMNSQEAESRQWEGKELICGDLRRRRRFPEPSISIF